MPWLNRLGKCSDNEGIISLLIHIYFIQPSFLFWFLIQSNIYNFDIRVRIRVMLIQSKKSSAFNKSLWLYGGYVVNLKL